MKGASEGDDMRIGQDLCIALVLAVVSVGMGRPVAARADADESLALVEGAMRTSGLSDADAASVRQLIALAQERERAGDEDGATAAMAQASSILGIA
jgi:hypothetical protein